MSTPLNEDKKLNKCKLCDFACYDYAYLAQHIEEEHKDEVREQIAQLLRIGLLMPNPNVQTIANEISSLLVERERQIKAELESEGWMYVPPSYRDTITKYVASAGKSHISLKDIKKAGGIKKQSLINRHEAELSQSKGGKV